MKKTSIRKIKNSLLNLKDEHFRYQDYRKDLGIVLTNEEQSYVDGTFVHMSECLSIVNYIKKTVKGHKQRAVYVGKELEDNLVLLPTSILSYKEKLEVLSKLGKFLTLDVELRDKGINLDGSKR